MGDDIIPIFIIEIFMIVTTKMKKQKGQKNKNSGLKTLRNKMY